MLSRRSLAAALLAGPAASLLARPAFASGKVVAGAIRWDAWNAGAGSFEQGPVQASLGPAEWHRRAPWFARPVGSDAIAIDGNQQAVMDAEITYASGAGLSYWAYCWYGYGASPISDDNMQKAWALHQVSSIKHRMNWCMLWQFGRLSPDVFASMSGTWAAYCRRPNYQKVLGGRPMVFILIDGLAAFTTNWGESYARLEAALDGFRGACASEGLGRPYIVIMYGAPDKAASIMSLISADAISNYGGSITTPASFSQEDQATRAYWAQMAATGAPVVPICQTGWDPRPRRQHPPPWEKQPPATWRQDFIPAGTPAQIATHVQAGVDYVLQHPTVCPSGALIIYSWNECDEGGSPLIPTYAPAGPDTAILDAVAGVLAR